MSRRLAAFCLLLACCAPLAALEVPYLAGRVNDLAALLSPGARERLEQKLAALERDTGAQVAVLTVPGLEGEVLEDFSLRVVETWQLGRKDVDDGALVLIARDDRKVRIEVGYGLEPVLTDVAAKRIIANLMTPRFRAGDFDGGVEAAVDAIAGTVRGEEGLIPPDPAGSEGLEGKLAPLAFFFVFVGLFALRAITTRGFAGWFLYVFLMPFFFVFPFAILGTAVAGLVALGLWIVAFPLLRRWLPQTSFGAPRRSRGGWSSGWSGGVFSGGGFSGGGFSGGGGSFGGGGASGSW